MIEFEHVGKTFPGGVEAVVDFTLSMAEGETLVLLGTSGSGKTTAMKMVNRLVEPSAGRILVEGRDVMEYDAIALRRKIGYSIQHIGLFPHMTVAENVAIPPQLLQWPPEQVAERVDAMLALVGLSSEEYRNRYPAHLSGGQRQRVGVARALAADPPIVLMDEPFGALDPLTREQLQDELLELMESISKTILFVTHDVFEAVKLADRIAILDAGRLQQIAAPGELVEQPANEFVEEFLGQHRFQLSLLTRPVRSLLPAREAEPADAESRPREDSRDPRLAPHDSLATALDLFKSSRRDSLAVVDRGRMLGEISKRDLLAEIHALLGGVEEDAA